MTKNSDYINRAVYCASELSSIWLDKGFNNKVLSQ